jgi:hypothetical protein
MTIFLTKDKLLYCLIVILVACENKSSLQSNIELGNYSGMRIQYHDTILIGGYHDKNTYQIDIDHDNENDIEISSNVWGSPGLGHHPEADIACLNQETYFKVERFSDTTYFNSRIDTFYDIDNHKVYIDNQIYYSCEIIFGNDSIWRIADNEHISILDKHEEITVNSQWICDSVNLNQLGGSPIPEYISISDDTIVRRFVYSYNECKSFPNDFIRYIGIKKELDDITLLGWVKLSISEYYKVSILESAIQN